MLLKWTRRNSRNTFERTEYSAWTLPGWWGALRLKLLWTLRWILRTRGYNVPGSYFSKVPKLKWSWRTWDCAYSRIFASCCLSFCFYIKTPEVPQTSIVVAFSIINLLSQLPCVSIIFVFEYTFTQRAQLRSIVVGYRLLSVADCCRFLIVVGCWSRGGVFTTASNGRTLKSRARKQSDLPEYVR